MKSEQEERDRVEREKQQAEQKKTYEIKVLIFQNLIWSVKISK